MAVIEGRDSSGNIVPIRVIGSGSTPGAIAVAGDATLADDFANPSGSALITGAFVSGFDGTTWDRIRSVTVPNNYPLGTTLPQMGALYTASIVVAWDSTNSRDSRVRCNVYGALAVTLDAAGASAWSAFDNINPAAINAQAMVVPIGRIRTSSLAGTAGNTAYPSLDIRGTLQTTSARPDAGQTTNNNATLGVVGGPCAVDSNDISLSASACFLQYLRVVSTESTNARYLQLHNTNAAIGAAAVPVISFYMKAGDKLELWGENLSKLAHWFTTGLRIGWSSTATTYTAAGTPKLEVTAAIYT